jgi:Mg/Co/Ni transporter MgtE
MHPEPFGNTLQKTHIWLKKSRSPSPPLARIPWLLLGLAGAFVAADLVGWFEVQLQAQVMLAFFLPGIAYLADAVGTQTETLVVRGLSVRHDDIRSIKAV